MYTRIVLTLEGVTEALHRVFQPTSQKRAIKKSLRVRFQRVGITVDIVEANLAFDQAAALSKFWAERQHVIDFCVESSFCAHICLTQWPTIL
ncbi:hypothetical protein DV706_20895 (plasmid) [Natronorubrum bangense]|uniref:Uncharacterized protein n=1 Tax=Natronorubrum bangense TaxID=61858 RepID=A0A4D6HSQ3_9EURY|nr:hypothetical protein DV706_20895 [Natronorubrum bangense]